MVSSYSLDWAFIQRKVVARDSFNQLLRGCQRLGTNTARSWEFYVILLGMKKFCLFVFLLMALDAHLFAHTDDADDTTSATCKEYLKTPLPSEAALIPAPKSWPECNSPKLYSGIGVKAAYAAARKCAWAERLAIQADFQPKYTVASLFGGPAMLAVLYANGEGVAQNKPLALRFGCEAGLNENGLNDIDALPSNPVRTGKKFIYCGEAFTTFEMNFCAEYEAEIAAQRRDDVLETFSSRWPKEHQAAFKLLQQANEDYVLSLGKDETYLGGTIRNLRVDNVEEQQRDRFLAAVKTFEGGHLPNGTASDWAKGDAELNLMYRKVIAAAKVPKEADDGAIQPEGIQRTERVWLKYRDAWVTFAKLHYPSTDPSSWLTLLTIMRTASLKMTLCGINDQDPSCTPEIRRALEKQF